MRRESPFAGGLAFLFAIGAYDLSDFVYAREYPFGYFLQWVASFLVAVRIPVVAFRSRLLSYCGLQKDET